MCVYSCDKREREREREKQIKTASLLPMIHFQHKPMLSKKECDIVISITFSYSFDSKRIAIKLIIIGLAY